MTSAVSHWPNVRDKPAFLHRMMVELAGDTCMSLEGDLSLCQFAEDTIVSHEETAVLTRQTLVPRQDFVVLRLTPETIDPIFKQVLEAGLKHAIIHVQIERKGVRELGAYDNFHSECVVTGPGVSRALLEELRQKAVLRDVKVATPRA